MCKKKKKKNVDSKLLTKNAKTKCAVCSSKKSRFMKEQKAKGILSSLGLQIPLSKIPLFGGILF